MVTIKGHCLILRNYDPGRAFRIMVAAFRTDTRLVGDKEWNETIKRLGNPETEKREGG